MKFVLADTACVYRLCRSHGGDGLAISHTPQPILTHVGLEGWGKGKGKGKGDEMEEGEGSDYRTEEGTGREIVISIISARQLDAMTERTLDLQKANHHTLRERACITGRLNGMRQAG
jgi:hypothetical protein